MKQGVGKDILGADEYISMTLMVVMVLVSWVYLDLVSVIMH